jgi:D-psicose/D-tagatose/L-ribulose 3-epimerase
MRVRPGTGKMPANSVIWLGQFLFFRSLSQFAFRRKTYQLRSFLFYLPIKGRFRLKILSTTTRSDGIWLDQIRAFGMTSVGRVNCQGLVECLRRGGGNVKIGLCMFLWTTRVGRQHEALLRDIKATGFDGVEIPVFEGDVAEYRELGRLLDDIGLQRTAVSAMGDPSMNLISADPATRARGIDFMKWAIDCSEALGARTLSGPLHSTLGQFSGKGPTPEEFEASIASQRTIGAHAAAHGVTIGLEALNRFECYLVNTMDALAAHIDAIGHPNIRAMYDTFHSNIEETDPIGAFTRNRDRIVHVHISENDRGVPGRGNIPWRETFRAIRQSGYDDWLTIESFGRALDDLAAATKVWRDFAESPEAVYREGYAHIRAGWQAAGDAR